MLKYYGYYNDVSRGKRKNQDQIGLITSVLEQDSSSKEYRKLWLALSKKDTRLIHISALSARAGYAY
jgi:hypothetical protein